MVRKRLEYEDMLAALDIPVLLTQGGADRVVLPAMSEALAQMIPGARLSLYEGTGHYPFAEEAARFNAELGQFAEACGAS